MYLVCLCAVSRMHAGDPSMYSIFSETEKKERSKIL